MVKSKEELLGIKGFGRRSLNEVVEILGELGLSLNMNLAECGLNFELKREVDFKRKRF